MIPESYRPDPARYAAVRAEVERVGAQTVLDFGAHNGHFSYRLALELGVDVTAVDQEYKLEPWTAKRGSVRSIHRRVEALGPNGIMELGRFDVVLAMSVLHHFRNWIAAFTMLRAAARKRLIIEVPNPAEELRKAVAKSDLSNILELVDGAGGGEPIAWSPATRQPNLLRGTYAIAPSWAGMSFDGSGNHARTQQQYGELFERELGWRPYPGSLNLRLLDGPHDFGPPQKVLKIGKRRVYEMWRARLPDFPTQPCVVMNLGDRGHGPDAVELLAPVRIRDLTRDPIVFFEVVW